MNEWLNQLAQLTAAHGVSGDEGEIRDLIRSMAEPYADEIREDPMGNLIVRKKGNGPRLMLAAHMDSIGVVATHIEKEGHVRFGIVGGLGVHELMNRTLRFANGTLAVCTAREDKYEEKELALKDLYLDLGASGREEAEKLISVGDTAAFVNPPAVLGQMVSGCYLDNRMGCLILLKALEQVQNPANDLYFVFTVQEEVGLRGSKTAAFAIDPAYGVAVDVTVPDNVPGSTHMWTAETGKGAAVKIMDRSVICHNGFVQKLCRIAEEHQIPAQKDILGCGGTDSGAIRIARGGVVTGGISVACRYTHSAVEMCHSGDVDACIALTKALCETALEEV